MRKKNSISAFFYLNFCCQFIRFISLTSITNFSLRLVWVLYRLGKCYYYITVLSVLISLIRWAWGSIFFNWIFSWLFWSTSSAYLIFGQSVSSIFYRCLLITFSLSLFIHLFINLFVYLFDIAYCLYIFCHRLFFVAEKF